MTQTTTHIGLREQILHSQSVDAALEQYKKLTTGTYPAKYVSRCASALKRTEQRLTKSANGNIPAKQAGPRSAGPKNNVAPVRALKTDWSPGEQTAGGNSRKGEARGAIHTDGLEEGRQNKKKVSRRFRNSLADASWRRDMELAVDMELP